MNEENIREPEVTETDQTSNDSQTTVTDQKNKSEVDYRTKQALDLLAALEDPNVAPTVIKAMAERLGLLDNSQKTTSEKQSTVKSVKDIVKSKLGDAGAFIADELGDALEAIMSEQQATITKQLQELEIRRAEAEFQREYSRAIEELEVTEDEAEALMKLVDEFPWNGKTSIKSYLANLVKFHRTNTSKDNVIKEKRMTNFQQQAKTKTASADESQVNMPKKFTTPKEAVEFAIRQLQKG